jgi:CRISPR system Cascade subunit CasD
MVKDFHTAHSLDGKTAFISNRYYLSDAVFVVALEGDDRLVADIAAALEHPVYPLFLGRRACPPASRIVLGVSGKPAVEALRDVESDAPWQAAEWYRKKQPETVTLEIVRDADFSEPDAFESRDMPVTFSQTYRQYAYRSVLSDPNAVEVHNASSAFVPPSERRQPEKDSTTTQTPTSTEHDAFNELEGEDVSVQSRDQ